MKKMKHILLVIREHRSRHRSRTFTLPLYKSLSPLPPSPTRRSRCRCLVMVSAWATLRVQQLDELNDDHSKLRFKVGDTLAVFDRLQCREHGLSTGTALELAGRQGFSGERGKGQGGTARPVNTKKKNSEFPLKAVVRRPRYFNTSAVRTVWSTVWSMTCDGRFAVPALHVGRFPHWAPYQGGVGTVDRRT